MAATAPTSPNSVQISVNPTPVRSISVANTTALTNYLAGTDGNGGPQFGDVVTLTAGATYSAPSGGWSLPVPINGSGPGVGSVGAVTAAAARPAIASVVAVAARAATASISAIGAGQNFVTFTSSLASNLAPNSRWWSGTNGPTPNVAGTVVTTNHATLQASSAQVASPVFAAADGAHHYRFVGLEMIGGVINAYQSIVNTAPSVLTDRTKYPSYFSFERCYIHGDVDFGALKGLQLSGSHFQVIDSYITNIYNVNNGDCNAIWMGYGGLGPYLLRNNRVEGMGENIFTGGSSNTGPAVTAGYEYDIPSDITITKNWITRSLVWQRTQASYVAPCDTAGTGTVSSSGTTLTFSVSQTGLAGKFIKNLTTGLYVKVNSGAGTTWTAATSQTFSAASFRYNSADMQAKNLLEFKAGQKVLIDSNVLQNGWADGQLVGSLQITPREYGWVADMEVRYNHFVDCSGMSCGVGDPEAGNGFGPSPYSTNRMWFHHNLHENASSPTANAIATNAIGWTLGANVWQYGSISYQIGGTIAAGTGFGGIGNSVTFTASGATIFDSTMVAGNVIAYSTGQATITAVNTGAQTITATVTAAFPDGTAHASQQWYVGAASKITTRFVPDSWVIEHNTIAGSNTGYTFPIQFTDDPGSTTGYNFEPIQKATNFVFRNNVMHSGTVPNNGAGVSGIVAASTSYLATTMLGSYVDSATLVWDKNVMFGPQTLSGNNFSQWYTGTELHGTGGTNAFTGGVTTAFHDPDQTGSTLGGSVGFADYAGGDYTISGYYATAATDGTMVGCGIPTLNASISGVNV